MSAPTVLWGVTIQVEGVRYRAHDTNGPYANASKLAAMKWAAQYLIEENNPRIVKLTRKPKPKVVAKTVFEFTKARGWMRDGHVFNGTVHRNIDDIILGSGRRDLHITITELADE